jgi:hypothetical protein
MAKLKGPLLSISAHGSIAKRITFSRRSTGNQVRYQKPNTDYNTPAQQTQRSLFLEALGKWNELTDEQQALWSAYNKE